MNSIITWFLAFAMSLGSFAAAIDGDKKASEVLAQARAALGGEKLAKVDGLAGAGTFQREIGGQQMTGELSLDIKLPDKLLRTESMSPFGDATIVTEQGVAADKLLSHAKMLNGGPNMVIRIPTPAPGSDAEAQALRNQRAELARLALGLLMKETAALPLEYSFGGEAESQDGKAQIVDVKGPGSFAARLFVDKDSHRPLMLVYRGAAPRVTIRRETAENQPPRPAGEAAAAPHVPPAEAAQIVDISLFFDDYKQVDGIWLPHHVSRSIDGKPAEEWTFKTFKVNPAFGADTFAAK